MSAGAISSLAASAFAFDGNLMDDTTLGWANSVRSSGAGMIAFGTISGGAGARLIGGNFWEGAVTGLIVSGLNHAMHSAFDGDTDPPVKKTINKVNKVAEVAEVTVASKQIHMSEIRKGLTIKDKIGTFGKFRIKYERLTMAGKVLGKINAGFTAYNIISDYNDSNVSSARFTYRLTGTATTIGLSTAAGAEFGAAPGAVVGFLGGLATAAGEIIYDGWNNTVMPVINQGTYETNNNHAWTNFHP